MAIDDINAVDSDARKSLLEEQFSEIEQQEVAPEPAQVDRVRDEAGRFATEAPQAQTNTPQEVKAEEEPLWRRPPASWKKDYHEIWKTADPKLQEYAWQREEQMRAGVEPLIQKAQFADQMHEVIQPYINTIRGLGIEPTQAVKALMEADHTLRNSDPQTRMNYFMQLAQSYGINLGNQPMAPVDNTVYSLQNELNKIRGEIGSWKEAQEQQQNMALLGEINNFATRAEYFEEARPAMIQLLNAGLAQTLEEAYDKAIRLTPELFETVQQQHNAKVQQQRSMEANRAAKAARAAAVSVRSSTPGSNTASKAQDRRSLLEEQFGEISSRV
jgi:hypothetical protein